MFCGFTNKTRGSLSKQMGSLAVHTALPEQKIIHLGFIYWISYPEEL